MKRVISQRASHIRSSKRRRRARNAGAEKERGLSRQTSISFHNCFLALLSSATAIAGLHHIRASSLLMEGVLL